MCSTATYEEILEAVEGLERGDGNENRDISWLSDAAVVGVARSPEGSVEVFLSGNKVKAASGYLKEILEYVTLYDDDESSLKVNRLTMQPYKHYDQFAALICHELLKAGVDTDLEQAFRDVQPIIDVVMERMRLADEAFIGLIGELILLHALCKEAPATSSASIVDGWFGWKPSTRDLCCNGHSMEVKTTLSTSSRHHIQGIHQIEDESQSFHLVSVGLQQSAGGPNSYSLSGLVQSIKDRLIEGGYPEAAERFEERVAQYGVNSGVGYRHTSMGKEDRYQQAYSVSFFRAYNMADPAIEVIRSADASRFGSVEKQSIRYTIDLPGSINTGNPIAGVRKVARYILGEDD